MTIHELLQAAGLTANDEIPIWDVDGTGEPTKKITAQQLAAAVVALANLVTGVKGNKESNYRHGDVNLTPANIGAKPTQTAVADPTASGTAVAFIDSISQNANGAITPTKKTVRSASQSESGLMSATDKAKLDGIAAGAHRYNFYTNPSQLELSGEKTVLEIFNALPNYSVIVTSSQLKAADMPGDSTTGELMIWKTSSNSRAHIMFYGKNPSTGTWRMYLGASDYNGNNANAPDGVWHRVYDDVAINTLISNDSQIVSSKLKTVQLTSAQTVQVVLPKSSSHLIVLSTIDPAARSYIGMFGTTGANEGTDSVPRRLDVIKGSRVASVTVTENRIVTIDLGTTASAVAVADLVLTGQGNGFATVEKVS